MPDIIAQGQERKRLRFTKMHGCGNDYIYINCFDQEVSDPSRLSVLLSDRHFSIGGDGVILMCPSETADVKMRMFNADGSEGRMCGNGIRCIAKLCYDEGIAVKDEITVETLSGIKTVRLTFSGKKVVGARVDMGRAELRPEKIPVLLDGDRIVSRAVEIGGKVFKITCVSMGNPHCVVFTDNTDSIDLETVGSKFESNGLFPQRVNTEFCEVISPSELKMRVWERGSGETWACGTGACATVAAACLNGISPAGKDVTVHLRGGDLTVNYTENTVFMTGNAVTSFKGEVLV